MVTQYVRPTAEREALVTTGPCSNCDASLSDCDARIERERRACCGTCFYTDTHSTRWRCVNGGDVLHESPCTCPDMRPAAPLAAPKRPTWDEHWMGHADVAAGRAACNRAQVGAVVVHDNWMVSEGYNGAPAGERECTDGGCPRGLLSRDECAPDSSYDNCVSIHAEVNALLRAGKNARGGVLYVTRKPCPWCAKVVKAAGIVRCVYRDENNEMKEYAP